MTLTNGYSKKPAEYRYATNDEVRDATGTIEVVDRRGETRKVRINGMPKTWKRKPGDVRIPYKYGLYEYGYLGIEDGEPFGPRMVIPVG